MTKPLTVQALSDNRRRAAILQEANQAIAHAVNLINQEQGITPAVVDFFDLLKTDSAICDIVINGIRQQNSSMAREIMKKSQLGEFLILKNKRIFTGNGVYTIKDVKTGVMEVITNFVINIQNGVGFEQEKETWFSGTLHLDKMQYPLWISTTSLNRLDTIMATLRSVVYKEAEDTVVTVPELLYPEHGTLLLRLIQRQTQGLAITMGLSKLGWNENGTQFTAPGWKATGAGVRLSASHCHPGNTLFEEYYDFKAYRAGAESSASDYVPWQANYFLAALVALLQRSRCGHGWPELRIQHNAAAEYLLRAIFEPLRQLKAIQSIGKKEIKSLTHYPIFFIGNKVPEGLPAFLLDVTGVVIPDNAVTEQHMAAISRFAFNVLSATIPFMAKSSTLMSALPCHNFFDLVMEGKAIIESAYGPLAVGKDKCLALWHYFSEIAGPDFSSHVCLDIREQKIYLSFHKIKTERRQVKTELTAAYPELRACMHGNRQIKIDAIAGMEMLREFFGKSFEISKRITPENSEAGGGSGSKNSLHTNT